MNNSLIIQLKAAFFLVVFSLNTIIGFACSIGMDLGFNGKHHHGERDGVIAIQHVHANGMKHEHAGKLHKHPGKDHNHQHEPKDDKANCCNDSVIKFVQVDKSLSPSLKYVIDPFYSFALLSSFYDIDPLVYSSITKNNKFFVRSYHPPIPDIRVAIQSFQI